MRTGNPAWKSETFAPSRTGSEAMTLTGTLAKIALLFIFLLATAVYTWVQYSQGENISYLIIAGIIGSLVFALITIFFPKASPVTALIYAPLEGLAIGGISAMAEEVYPGIVIQTVSLTLAVLAVLLLLYASGIIKVTKKFRLMVISATLAIFLVYITSFVLRYFFQMEIPYLHSSGWIGIAINVFIAGIAALNLVLDFDYIERGVNRKAPKYIEWYTAFGLMITLVWLYFEILRLLQKIRR